MSFVDATKSHVDVTNTHIKVYDHYFDDDYVITPPNEAKWHLRTNLSWREIWRLPVGKIDSKGMDDDGNFIVFPTNAERLRFIKGMRKKWVPK